ncbi:hypothetical protein OC834_001862 [Tilletia horrida]|nr:hypothetical protein OC834_001862 [Tilletia horrida]
MNTSACTRYVLTFHVELDILTKKRPFRNHLIPYFLTRYCCLSYIIPNLLVVHSGRRMDCQANVFILIIMAATTQVLSQVMFSLRAWALWNYDRRVAAFLTALWIPHAVLSYLVLYRFHAYWSPDIIGSGGLCILSEYSIFAVPSYALLLAVDIVVGAMILFRLFSLRQTARSRFTDVLARDLFLYMLCCIVPCTTGIVVAMLNHSTALRSAIYIITTQVHAIFSCRAFLNTDRIADQLPAHLKLRVHNESLDPDTLRRIAGHLGCQPDLSPSHDGSEILPSFQKELPPSGYTKRPPSRPLPFRQTSSAQWSYGGVDSRSLSRSCTWDTVINASTQPMVDTPLSDRASASTVMDWDKPSSTTKTPTPTASHPAALQRRFSLGAEIHRHQAGPPPLPLSVKTVIETEVREDLDEYYPPFRQDSFSSSSSTTFSFSSSSFGAPSAVAAAAAATTTTTSGIGGPEHPAPTAPVAAASASAPSVTAPRRIRMPRVREQTAAGERAATAAATEGPSPPVAHAETSPARSPPVAVIVAPAPASASASASVPTSSRSASPLTPDGMVVPRSAEDEEQMETMK